MLTRGVPALNIAAMGHRAGEEDGYDPQHDLVRAGRRADDDRTDAVASP